MVIIHPIHMFIDVLARPLPQKHMHVSGNSLVRLMKRVCNTIETMAASEPTNVPMTLRVLDAQSMYRIIQSGGGEVTEIMQSSTTEYSMEAVTSCEVELEEELRRELLYSHCIIPQGVSIFMASVMETLSLLKCQTDTLMEENIAGLEDVSQDYITRSSDPLRGTLLEIHQHESRLIHDALHGQNESDFRSFWTRFNAYLCPLFLQAAQRLRGFYSPSSPMLAHHDHERADPRKETDILSEIVENMAVRACGMLNVVWMKWFVSYLSLLNDECVLSPSKKRIVRGYQKHFGVEIMRPSVDEIANLCKNMSSRDAVSLLQEVRFSQCWTIHFHFHFHFHCLTNALHPIASHPIPFCCHSDTLSWSNSNSSDGEHS
jgi:hypothetical protein